MIDWESEDGITTIIINRPDCMNALNDSSLERLDQIVSKLLHDRKTRVVVFTGVGEKAFCSGADLKERRTFTKGTSAPV